MKFSKISMSNQPLAMNVCDQLLRELGGLGNWSLAHVVMNPLAWSLLHKHEVMEELYVITRGTGLLVRGNHTYAVQAGDAIHIPADTPHLLYNTGLGTLEHLVLASPPFNPEDVIILDESKPTRFYSVEPFVRPPVEECFDGARIVGYQFADASVAFGWVNRDPERQKPGHFHRETEEWIYVIEGRGEICIDNMVMAVTGGDIVKVGPEHTHAIRCTSDQNLVVVCICTPRFDMADVHYR